MPQLDQIDTFASQIFWLVVTFIPLYLLLWRVVLPRISATLGNRQQRIENDILRAEELSHEAQEVMEAYEAELAEARAKAQEGLHKAAEEAQAEADRRNAEIADRLAADAAAARERIDAARVAAVANVAEIANEISRQAVERLVGESPAPDRVQAAVQAVVGERR